MRAMEDDGKVKGTTKSVELQVDGSVFQRKCRWRSAAVAIWQVSRYFSSTLFSFAVHHYYDSYSCITTPLLHLVLLQVQLHFAVRRATDTYDLMGV
jgi:hypothetical protein